MYSPTSSIILFCTLLQLLLTCACGFAFQLPQIRMPWDSNAPTSSSLSSNNRKAPLMPNDKIVIFGGTGGVGQLVTRKLRARKNKSYNICVVARNAGSAKEVLLPADDKELGLEGNDLTIEELNLVGDNKATDDELKSAMEGASGELSYHILQLGKPFPFLTTSSTIISYHI